MSRRWLTRRIFGRPKSVDGPDDAATVLPGISINGHFPSSQLRLTGRVSGKSKNKGTFLRIHHNERNYFERDGRWHRVFRALHRPNRLGLPVEAWYAEAVVDEETGEVVHSDSEPLAKHTGHGV